MLVGAVRPHRRGAVPPPHRLGPKLAPPRTLVRERVRVSVAGASEHELLRDPHGRASRIPTAVHDAIRRGLERAGAGADTAAGYASTLACERCRTPPGATVLRSAADRRTDQPAELPVVR